MLGFNRRNKMYRITNKKTGEVVCVQSLEDAHFWVRASVVTHNMHKRNSDRKTNYIIKEVQK